MRGAVGGYRVASAAGTDTATEQVNNRREPVEPEEQARARIAADIHDDTIQTLDAVSLNLQTARDETTDPGARAALETANEHVRQASERLRRLMFELMPPVPVRGLRTSVETYCALMLTPSPLSFEIIGDPPPLAPEISLLAYRLIQEALRNSARHSGGRRVRIELDARGGELLTTISDDGTGIAQDAGLAPTHAGLRIAGQRVEAVGGIVSFGTGIDGRGSSVRFVIPLRGGDTG